MKYTSSSRGRNPFQQTMMLLACVAWLAWAGGRAQAAVYTWSNAAGGDYTNAANWGGSVPGPSDSAQFNKTNAYTVNLSCNYTNNDLRFESSAGNLTFNFNSNSLTLDGTYFGWLQMYQTLGTNTVNMNNGTIYLPTNTITWIGACGQAYQNSMTTLVFSNMTLIGRTFGVASADGLWLNQSVTWNAYNSTISLVNFGIASSGGHTDTTTTATALIGQGSTLSVTNGFAVGQSCYASVGNLNISNGTLFAFGGLTLGVDYNNVGNMNISGNGQAYVGGTIQFGRGNSTSNLIANGHILIDGPNALLEANTLNRYYVYSIGTVTNNGGILQYTSATPYQAPQNPLAFGTLVVTNGTTSLRAITNADVFCNQSGKPLDSAVKMLWTGTSNKFRLNNASNSMAINQTYTFAPGTATNFARLEMLNSSTYRNGSVTIGAGGSLYLSSGASTISSVLTAAPSSTIEFDLSNTNAPGCLLSTTNVYLNGCTLQLDLASPPILNTPFLIISNSLASQLSYSFAGSNTKQTFTLNGTNYLTTINLANGGTEVVVQTTIPARGTTAFFR